MPNSYTRAQRVASFFSRVTTKAEGECWLWRGCQYFGGYGSFSWRGRMRGAHIVSWEIANGHPVPAGLDVRHTCDVTLCVNPRHLIAGTTKENMVDMRLKGRGGSSGRNPLLTADQVRSIRRLFGSMKQTDIADKFRVTSGVISKLKVGKSYQWVA